MIALPHSRWPQQPIPTMVPPRKTRIGAPPLLYPSPACPRPRPHRARRRGTGSAGDRLGTGTPDDPSAEDPDKQGPAAPRTRMPETVRTCEPDVIAR